MNEELVTDVYTRFATHEHLLMQLYLQFAHSSENPEATLQILETRLAHVMSSLKPAAHGMEDWAIKLLQAQRTEGPVLVQDFFRKVRANLPKN